MAAEDVGYHLGQEELTWSDAQAACESLGGNLASISNEQENLGVAALIEESSEFYWIGATDFISEVCDQILLQYRIANFESMKKS